MNRVVCPVHGLPDCSPLLNGCSRLTAKQDGIREGLRRRDETLDALSEDERNAWDRSLIDKAIEEMIRREQPFSANEIRELLPEVHQPLIGARVRAYSYRKHIARVGSVPSSLPSTKGHYIGWYIGTEKGREALLP